MKKPLQDEKDFAIPDIPSGGHAELWVFQDLRGG
jgi:hypothetical protein